MTRKKQIIQAAKQAEKKDGFTQIVKDAKGVNSAYGIGFLEGAEWADEHPIHFDEAMPHILYKGMLQGKKEMLDKACEWINLHIGELSDIYTRSAIRNEFLEDFRKAMEE